jgi:hypothetical protein
MACAARPLEGPLVDGERAVRAGGAAVALAGLALLVG